MEEDIKNKLQLPMICGLNRNQHWLYVVCYNKINKLIEEQWLNQNFT